MGRALLSLVLTLLAIGALVAGGMLLLAYLLHQNDATFAWLINFVQERGGSVVVFIGWVLLLPLAVILYLFASLGPTEPRSFRFNTDLGRVGISLPALENFIARQAKDLPMVESLRPTVTTSPDGKRLRLSMQASVIASGSVKNVSEGVQDAVVRAIRDGLGLTEVDTVDVDVTKIATPKGGLANPPAISGEPVETPLLRKPEPVAGSGDADEAHHPVS